MMPPGLQLCLTVGGAYRFALVPTAEERLAVFYERRAAEEPASDPEATIRFAKAAATGPRRPLLLLGFRLTNRSP